MAHVYTHVLIDGAELDYGELLGTRRQEVYVKEKKHVLSVEGNLNADDVAVDANLGEPALGRL